MNKYEKAIDNISQNTSSRENVDVEVLYELVERATPKKTKHIYPYECPNDCGTFALSKADNYCPNCGQALDWSE